MTGIVIKMHPTFLIRTIVLKTKIVTKYSALHGMT